MEILTQIVRQLRIQKCDKIAFFWGSIELNCIICSSLANWYWKRVFMRNVDSKPFLWANKLKRRRWHLVRICICVQVILSFKEPVLSSKSKHFLCSLHLSSKHEFRHCTSINLITFKVNLLGVIVPQLKLQ